MKRYYCHYEEKFRPAEDFTLVILRSDQEAVKSDKTDTKPIPRALCDECIAKGRSLGGKYGDAGKTKKGYLEYGEFRG